MGRPLVSDDFAWLNEHAARFAPKDDEGTPFGTVSFLVCSTCGSARRTAIIDEPKEKLVLIAGETPDGCSLCTEVFRRTPEVFGWAKEMVRYQLKKAFAERDAAKASEKRKGPKRRKRRKHDGV